MTTKQTMLQTTLAKEITLHGVGVHNGKPSSITLTPAAADNGITLSTNTCPDRRIRIGTIIPQPALHATVLAGSDWLVSTIEHVMATLGGMSVDNVHLHVEGDEVPILDGSSYPFVQAIQEVGLVQLEQPKKYLTPRAPLTFEDDEGRTIRIEPACTNKDGSYDTQLHIDYTASFATPLAGSPAFKGSITTDFFTDELAPARTFGFLAQMPFLHKHGLAQGTTLGNTLVIGEDELLNEPRMADECVRHKVLDLIGDLSLLGTQLAGSVVAHKTGHRFNRLVIEHFVNHPGEWQYI